MPKPRKHGANEKLEEALAAIKGELTIAQITAKGFEALAALMFFNTQIVE